MSYTNLDILTEAYQKAGIVRENETPSPEQGVTGLNILNDMLADWGATGVRLGWFPQTSQAATTPLRDSDVMAVKLQLAVQLALNNGLTAPPLLVGEAEAAFTRMCKRALFYLESDLSELSRPQASPGSAGWY